jgi:hypothetical protein
VEASLKTHLVTRYAGSVIVSGPTRTWPCSINLTAYINVRTKLLAGIAQAHTALTVSDILDMHMNTASRLRQNAATVSLFSTSLSFAVEFNTPMSYNFDSNWPSMRVRKGSWTGSRETRCANERSDPQSLLYLRLHRGTEEKTIVGKTHL